MNELLNEFKGIRVHSKPLFFYLDFYRCLFTIQHEKISLVKQSKNRHNIKDKQKEKVNK